MKEPDYQGFWDTLPLISMLGSRPELQEAFRHEHREAILGLLSMLHRLGLVWSATSPHPDPPEEGDLCGEQLADCQFFVDGQTVSGFSANICPKCFLEEGHSLGWGKGQLYVNLGDGSWRLVAGGRPDGQRLRRDRG
jgi:hypothetical protein